MPIDYGNNNVSTSGLLSAASGQFSNGLHIDAGNFGIGTTTPSGQLHVVGTGLFSSGLGINTTNFNFFDIYNNNRNATVSVSGDVFIQNALYFYNPSEVDNRRRGLISSDGDAILNTLGVGEKGDTLGNSVVMNTNGLVVNNAGGLGGSACQLLGDYGAIIENILIVNSNSNGNATVGIGTSTPSASLDVVGDVNIDGNLTFDSFTESVVSNGNSGTSKTLSLASGTVHTCTLTGNCTFTMPATTAGKSFTMFLNSGSGNYTASFSGVRWADSATPTATILANKVDIYSFISDGTYWYGSFSQNYG